MTLERYEVELLGVGAQALEVELLPTFSAPVPPPPEPVVPPLVRWRNAAIECNESQGTQRMYLELADVHAAPLRVTVDKVSGTMTPGDDFTDDFPATVDIPAGTTDLSFYLLRIVDDTATEVAEYYDFAITGCVELAPQPGFEAGTEQSGPFSAEPIRITVSANDPVVPEVNWGSSVFSLRENETSGSLVTLQLSEAYTSDVTVNVQQTAGPDVSSRVQWPSTVIIPQGSTSLDFLIEGLEQTPNVVQAPQTFTLTIDSVAPSPQVRRGPSIDLEVTIQDPPTTVIPQIGFTFTQGVLYEPGQGLNDFLVVQARIVNAAELAVLEQDITVSLDQVPWLTPSAILGTDVTVVGDVQQTFRVSAGVNEVRTWRLEAEPDIATSETAEFLRLQPTVQGAYGELDPNFGTLDLTIFPVPATTDGGDLEILFHYPSDVTYSADSRTREFVISMQRAFSEDVVVELDHYSPNADEGTHYPTLPQFVTIPANEREVVVQFTLPDAAVLTDSRWIISRIVDVSHGYPGMNDVHFLFIGGDTDQRQCIPTEPGRPLTPDYRVYADRVVRTSDGLTFFTSSSYYDRTNAWGTISDNGLGELWLGRNPQGARWMEQGQPVVIAIMEDLLHGMRLNGDDSGLRFLDAAGVQFPMRDVWIYGDGGMRTIGFLRVDNQSSSGDPMPLDQLHFVDVQFEHPYGGVGDNKLVGSSSSNLTGDPAYRSGLLRFNTCNFFDEGHPSVVVPQTKFAFRLRIPANYWITDCDFGQTREHVGPYVDRIQGMFLFARNQSLWGGGRTQCQLVTRPQDVGGTPSHGIAAIVAAEDVNLGANPQIDNGTAAHSIYGFLGDVWYFDNLHLGVGAGVTGPYGGTSVSVRAGLKILSRDDPRLWGQDVLEWPLNSGRFYLVKRLRFDGDNFTTGSGTLENKIHAISGCYEVDIGDFSVTLAEGVTLRAIMEFNTDPLLPGQIALTAVRDQRGRNVQAFTPIGLRNRPTGIGWSGPTQGSLLAYPGVAASTSKYRYASYTSGFQVERDFDVTGTADDINFYDGTDIPVP